ncbi:MAG: serine hydrolase [Cyanobacteria bacterium P01_G01_bin.39]
MTKLNDTNRDSVSLTKELETYLQAYLSTNYFMGSVLVSRGSEVLLSKGYSMANLEHSIPNTPQTKFRLGSITKQFTATAILKLQEQQLLDVNNSLATYLPEYPQGEQITLHQLLNHTAGIPNYTSFEDCESRKRTTITLDELIAWFSNRPLDFTPGDRFSYSNSGYVVLTKVIETVSSISYANYLQENIFEPLDMNNSGYDSHETILPNRAAGYIFTGEEYQNADFIDMSLPAGAGALYSTVEDLHKWSQSLNTDAVLSQASLDAMFAQTIKVPTDDENEAIYYGYGWMIDTLYNRHRVSHDGGIDGFVTHLARYPHEQITIVVLSNLVTSSISKIEKDLAAIIFGEPYEFPKQRETIKIDSTIYENYVGKYKFESSSSLPPEVQDFILTITTDSQRIYTQLTGQDIVEIFPESPSKFFLKIVDAQLTFITDNTEQVSQLILHQNGRDTMLNKIE